MCCCLMPAAMLVKVKESYGVNMVRIVATSDTHTKHKEVPVPDGDIFIHAGDLTGLGNYHEYISVGNWFRKLKDQFKYRIMIAGNHDFSLMINKRVIMHDHFDSEVIYLEDSGIKLDGIYFYGSPWTPQYRSWAFMQDDADLSRYYAHIPNDVDVLITHGPPFGILDKEEDQERCGSRTLLNRVKELKNLKHHIFGHIHESYGEEKIDDVTFHNVCALNGNYRYQNPPQVIDL